MAKITDEMKRKIQQHFECSCGSSRCEVGEMVYQKGAAGYFFNWPSYLIMASCIICGEVKLFNPKFVK